METNDYPNWLVSVEQAKRLREIGFDKECHFFWNFYEDVNELCCYADISEEDDNFLFPDEYNYNNKDSTGYYVYLSIPSYEQVLEWFREKGIVGTIGFLPILGKNIYVYEIHAPFVSCKEEFLSYEKAREELVYRLIEQYTEYEQAKKEREAFPCDCCDDCCN